MRLVEAVAGELLHQIEQLIRLRAGHAVLLCAGLEDIALACHLFRLLLSHRAPQQVCGTETVTADDLSDLHDLLLVHHDSVGRRQNRFHARIRILEALLPVLALDEIRNEFHRPGPEQCAERNDVFEAVGFRLLEQALHASGFELEYGRRSVCGARVRTPCGSSSGSRSISSAAVPSARASLIAVTVQSMIVSVLRPRKSNFTSPARSTSSLSNCETRRRSRRRRTAARSR